MLKHIVVLIAASIIVILAMSYAQQAVQFLVMTHDFVSEALTNVFSGGQAGHITKGLIALLSMPILIALIPTVLYWAAKKHAFPYFMQIVWVIWLIQAGALIMVSA